MKSTLIRNLILLKSLAHIPATLESIPKTGVSRTAFQWAEDDSHLAESGHGIEMHHERGPITEGIEDEEFYKALGHNYDLPRENTEEKDWITLYEEHEEKATRTLASCFDKLRKGQQKTEDEKTELVDWLDDDKETEAVAHTRLRKALSIMMVDDSEFKENLKAFTELDGSEFKEKLRAVMMLGDLEFKQKLKAVMDIDPSEFEQKLKAVRELDTLEFRQQVIAAKKLNDLKFEQRLKAVQVRLRDINMFGMGRLGKQLQFEVKEEPSKLERCQKLLDQVLFDLHLIINLHRLSKAGKDTYKKNMLIKETAEAIEALFESDFENEYYQERHRIVDAIRTARALEGQPPEGFWIDDLEKTLRETAEKMTNEDDRMHFIITCEDFVFREGNPDNWRIDSRPNESWRLDKYPSRV